MKFHILIRTSDGYVNRITASPLTIMYHKLRATLVAVDWRPL